MKHHVLHLHLAILGHQKKFEQHEVIYVHCCAVSSYEYNPQFQY